MAGGTDTLQTVERAADVLAAFIHRESWTISGLAKYLNLHKSIVYRIVHTLRERGFLEQNAETHQLTLGLQLLHFGNLVHRRLRIREVALPFMRQIMTQTQETTFLTVVHASESICIEKVDSPHSIKMTLDIGGRYPLYAGASNKVMLAYLPDIIERLQATGLPAGETDTPLPQDLSALLEDLQSIREGGYAVTTGEVTEGVTAVAVPILSTSGRLLAALSVGGPSTRLTGDRIPGCADAMRDAAGQISHQYVEWGENGVVQSSKLEVRPAKAV